MQEHAIGHKYLSSHKVQTKLAIFEGFHVDAEKRAPKRSKGKHLCHSRKMQPKEEALVKPEGSTMPEWEDATKGRGLW